MHSRAWHLCQSDFVGEVFAREYSAGVSFKHDQPVRLQVAINWCLCKDTIPIPGAKNLRQAEEALEALGWRMSSAEVAALEDASDVAPRGMLQNIFQTK